MIRNSEIENRKDMKTNEYHKILRPNSQIIFISVETIHSVKQVTERFQTRGTNCNDW